MGLLKKIFELFNFTDVSFKKRKKKPPTILSELKTHPENFKLEAYIENEEITVKIKKKGS